MEEGIYSIIVKDIRRARKLSNLRDSVLDYFDRIADFAYVFSAGVARTVLDICREGREAEKMKRR